MKNNYFANNLKYLRERRGLEQKDISDMLGLKSPTSVTNWERGTNLARSGHLSDLANYFGVTLHDLMNKDLSNNESTILDDIISVTNELTPPRQQKVYTYAEDQLEEQNLEEEQSIYLVGQTAAGSGVGYNQLNAEQINTNVPNDADYALTVKGDSMEPLIENGQIIFYKQQPVVENGEIAIVELNGREVTCKKFYKEDEKVILKSINDKYEDMIIEDEVRVIGKVLL
ncbi:LexA family transcriptional regulator [Aerococcaceae bacterium DSM 111020]|nr:LexA family transcriptional regulator [Aerococcaceae bacterium DSM 111020]